jgi:hypothetical protein
LHKEFMQTRNTIFAVRVSPTVRLVLPFIVLLASPPSDTVIQLSSQNEPNPANVGRICSALLVAGTNVCPFLPWHGCAVRSQSAGHPHAKRASFDASVGARQRVSSNG